MPGSPEDTIVLAGSAVVVAKAGIVGTGLDDEYVVLDPGPGKYYGLNTVATAIWEFIQHPRRVAEIEAHVCERFDVTPDRCRRDVSALVDRLVAHGLAVHVDDGATPAPANAGR